MNYSKALLVICFISTPLLLKAQDLTQNEFGNGLVNVVAKDSSYSAKFAVRFQSLYILNSARPNELGFQDAETNFLVRRARLNFGGFAYTPKTDINTFFGDAMFKYEGLSVMAECTYCSADNPVARHTDGTPAGAIVNIGDASNFQTGYVFGNDHQVVGRYTHLDLDEQFFGTNETQYTLGFSKYFVGHKLKVQSDINYPDLI